MKGFGVETLGKQSILMVGPPTGVEVVVVEEVEVVVVDVVEVVEVVEVVVVVVVVVGVAEIVSVLVSVTAALPPWSYAHA
jgi:hypothetical protein